MNKLLLVTFQLGILTSFTQEVDKKLPSDSTVNQKAKETPIVETPPSFDLVKLYRLIEYPEIARMSGIEGKVVLGILIGKDGSQKKIKVLTSDSKLLNQSAIKAVKDYGNFEPALQDGEPIACWVTVPITYKLTK